MTRKFTIQLANHDIIDYLLYYLRKKKIKHKIIKISDKNQEPHVIISTSLKKREIDKIIRGQFKNNYILR